jgi:predicted regulator of Ras-like GTPase activity (Roadblock/LC7/MglB family)
VTPEPLVYEEPAGTSSLAAEPVPQPTPAPEPLVYQEPAETGPLAPAPAPPAAAEPAPAAPEPAAEPTAPPVKQARPAKEKLRDGQQGAFDKILADLVQTPQVLAALLVDESGGVIATAFAAGVAADVDEEASGMLAYAIFRTGQDAIQKVKMGDIERVVIDTTDQKIFLNRAGPLLLLVSADPAAKVGLVAVNSKQAVERIKALAVPS